MNKNTLNAQRLLQYFCKDWSENAAQLYYYFIIPYGIMTLLFIWMDFTKTHSVVVALEQVRQGMETDNNSYQLIMENALSSRPCCVSISSWPLRAALFSRHQNTGRITSPT